MLKFTYLKIIIFFYSCILYFSFVSFFVSKKLSFFFLFFSFFFVLIQTGRREYPASSEALRPANPPAGTGNPPAGTGNFVVKRVTQSSSSTIFRRHWVQPTEKHERTPKRIAKIPNNTKKHQKTPTPKNKICFLFSGFNVVFLFVCLFSV